MEDGLNEALVNALLQDAGSVADQEDDSVQVEELLKQFADDGESVEDEDAA
jgi:hypothetical protein